MYLPPPDYKAMFGKDADLVKEGWKELERLRKEMKETYWWQFIKRRRLIGAIYYVNGVLAAVGVQRALSNLERWGLIKPVKK